LLENKYGSTWPIPTDLAETNFSVAAHRRDSVSPEEPLFDSIFWIICCWGRSIHFNKIKLSNSDFYSNIINAA
jgi:hypothetical protein